MNGNLFELTFNLLKDLKIMCLLNNVTLNITCKMSKKVYFQNSKADYVYSNN